MPSRTIKQIVLTWLLKMGREYLLDGVKLREIVQDEVKKLAKEEMSKHAQHIVNALGGADHGS